MLSGARSVQDQGRNESSAAQMARNDRDSRSSAAIRPRGFGAHRGHRGLRKRLHGVRDLVQELPVTGGEYAYASACVGPDLKVWAVPRHGEAELSRLGLSLPRNSQNRSRTGLKGITAHGKKQVRWACRLMEEMRKRLAMWTVSLPNEDYLPLASSRQWPQFQRRLIDLLTRYLKAHGDEAVCIGVVEVGPKRFADTGIPMPHIHIVTTGWGRRHPEGGWLLSRDRMDDLVSKACQYAGLPLRPRPAASQIARVEHSVSSYMSKYLTKELPVDVDWEQSGYADLIPHQWWNQSAACKALVGGCVFKLPPAFAAFVVRCHGKLEALGLGRGGYSVVAQRETLLGTVPIELLKFRFASPEALHSALELFVVWVVNSERLDMSELAMSG